MRNYFIRKLINAGIAAVTVFAFCTLPGFSTEATAAASGNRIAAKVDELKRQNVFNNEYKPFTVSGNNGDVKISAVVTEYTLLNMDHSKVTDILASKPEYMKVVVPSGNGSSNFILLLYKANISPAGLTILTSDNLPVANNVVHYRGCIDNDLHSVVSMTFSENETMGMICNDEGNYVLGKIKDPASERYIIYNDHHLVPHSSFECLTNSASQPEFLAARNATGSSNSTTTTNCVNWYWETDYDVFVDKGSSANVNSYIQGVFNQVSTLYANDGMTINLQTVYIWTTTDPYTGPGTNDYLTQFGNNRTSFAGNLAHLIGYNGGGGIAWVDGLCSTAQFEQGYAGISSNYNTVPTYSWTVECIAHEEGHLMGSNHTHDCVWNGNNTAIDGCGNAAGYAGGGGCASGPYPPTGGQGTIMSYCHLNVGINFNLGFGPQPTTLMVNNINTASCLSACGGGCSTPAQPAAISGNTPVCPSTTQTYSVTAVSGATSYTWTLPSGWSGSSATNSITVTTGSSAGNISVTANNSCGSSTVRTKAVTVSTSVPAQPGTISGNSSVCPSSSQTYSVTAVSGATIYTWTLPSGWSGSSTTNSITVTAGSAGGTISVLAVNGCGSSAARTLIVSITSSSPAQPGTISGSTAVCPSSSQTYSVTAVSGATSYTWTLPSGWSGSSTTNSITVTTGSAGGTVSVTANNGCGSSAARTLAVTMNTATPSQPTTISGNAAVCPGSSQMYSVSSVSGATSYTWTIPSGWSGSSTTNSITVVAGSTGGSITVKANNSCGSSAVRTLALTINASTPSQPGTISGNTSVCPGSSQTYSVTAVSGATTYTWTLPSGWSGSSTTNSITVTAGNSGGTISIAANNSCGTSTQRTLAVSIGSTPPSQPGTISGNASVCPGSSQTYSVTTVSGAASYSWTLPSGWSGSSTTNSITVIAGSSGGTVSITAANSCGTSTPRTLAVSISTTPPAQPGAISGNSPVCPGSSQTYSVTTVSGATGYTWTLPSGWSGSSTSNSITVTAGTTGGTITVTANNTCGNSAARTKSVALSTAAPSQPGTISGSSSACPGTSQTYSVSSVSGATSYTWTLPSGWSGSSTTNLITVTTGSSGGTISVTANNSCGSSATRTKSVTISSATPAQPGAITGSTTVCPGTSEVYSVSAVSGATSYTWTLPSGWSGSSTTNSITVISGSSAGSISVLASNSCGSSSARTMSIGISTGVPTLPGIISGNSSMCPGTSSTYYTYVVSGATSYTWTLPSGWSGSSTTNSIVVTVGNTGGVLSVRANNSCGSSQQRARPVSVTPVPAQPSNITGNLTVCPNSSQAYSVSPVSGASGYIWTLPADWTGSSVTNSIAAGSGTVGGTISVAASNSCGTSAAKLVTVGVTPSAGISLHQAGTYVVVSSVNTVSNIQWYYQNTLVSGSNDSLLCIGVGSYRCVVTNTYGCQETSASLSVTSMGVTGVSENAALNFEIFPNPATDFIRIRNVNEVSESGVQFCIFNVEGKKVSETMINSVSADIDVKNISSGFYFYKLMDGTAILQSGKIVILRGE